MRAVSIVPAVYYADLVATRAKCYMSKDRDKKLANVTPDLQSTMFFT
jgi:hypothetical protein